MLCNLPTPGPHDSFWSLKFDCSLVLEFGFWCFRTVSCPFIFTPEVEFPQPNRAAGRKRFPTDFDLNPARGLPIITAR
jgi:hypothetical protein